MKKILAIILAICTVLSLSTVAMAAEIHEDGSQSAATTVTYGVSEQYTVTIPDSIALKSTDPEDAVACRISVADALLQAKTQLRINIDGEYDWGMGEWCIYDMENPDNKLLYIIHDNAENEVAPGNIVLSLQAGEQAASTTLKMFLDQEPTQAGEYVGALTFTVETVGADFVCPGCEVTRQLVNGFRKCGECWHCYDCDNTLDYCACGRPEGWCNYCNSDELPEDATTDEFCDYCEGHLYCLKENEVHCWLCGICPQEGGCDDFLCSVCWYQPAERLCPYAPAENPHCTAHCYVENCPGAEAGEY